MRIAVFSWNAGESLEKQDARQLSQWLTPSTKERSYATSPDIYAIGIQESIPLPQALAGLTASRCSPYERKLQQELQSNARLAHKADGPQYQLIGKATVGALQLIIYANEAVAHRVRSISSASAGCGPLFMSNKGAVGLRLQLQHPEESITFVTAHLAAHDYNVSRRNLDWKAIVSRLVFHSHIDGRRHQLYDSDHLYLFGDLNYRISLIKPNKLALHTLASLLDDKEYQTILQQDQLNQERTKGCVCQGLGEGLIVFPPTYKYKVGTDTLTPFTKRVPSWCDRILHAHSSLISSVEQPYYQSVIVPNASDHMPVNAIYSTSTQPVRPNAVHTQQSPFIEDSLQGPKKMVGWLADRAVGYTWCGVSALGLGNDKAGLLLLFIAFVTTVALLRPISSN